jgi:arginyl-tRNA synthetase
MPVTRRTCSYGTNSCPLADRKSNGSTNGWTFAFDYEYGESFYHQRLGDVVEQFQQRGLARTSEGAVCVFLDGFDTPMIVQKSDGAFLYATTDLATIDFRMQNFQPDAIFYVVDHRQKEHFDKLFAAARLWGYSQVDLTAHPISGPSWINTANRTRPEPETRRAGGLIGRSRQPSIRRGGGQRR